MKLDCCSLDVGYEEESAVLLLKRSLCCCCYWTTQEAGLRNLRLKSIAAAMQHSSSSLHTNDNLGCTFPNANYPVTAPACSV
ncbi:unnamed protein product [Sphagnum jensenii]|uniref:Uncharacterized protein n=1 Tax=Sphagnum jensenii TaxID=128206 RepID=A0ABP1B662_9BRYO